MGQLDLFRSTRFGLRSPKTPLVPMDSEPSVVHPKDTQLRPAGGSFSQPWSHWDPFGVLDLILVFHLGRRVAHRNQISTHNLKCVCVCVHPWTKGFPPPLFSPFFHHFQRAGGSRVCSWREPTKLQVQTRISKEDALSTYLRQLLTKPFQSPLV